MGAALHSFVIWSTKDKHLAIKVQFIIQQEREMILEKMRNRELMEEDALMKNLNERDEIEQRLQGADLIRRKYQTRRRRGDPLRELERELDLDLDDRDLLERDFLAIWRQTERKATLD